MRIDKHSRVKDVYRNPLGHDIIEKILLFKNIDSKWVNNPLVRNIKLKHLAALSKKHFNEDFWKRLFELLNQEQDTPTDVNQNPKKTWWKEAVFYQIYPRSFQDSNGDGIGDLQGIISRLDYIQSLGVDAVWLSPIYDSPNDDNGYDIRDYQKIMEEMGTMEDFDQLLEGLHSRGMRLIMDLVINHSSDEHEWFQEALHNPDSDKRNYYFFRDGEEQELPNNWVSFFSGPAWKYFPDQKQWVMHLFSEKQMDFNWEYAPLREELYDMVRWWLEKGVDGFRLDVINYISKEESLANGNPQIGELVKFQGIEQYFYGPNLHRHLRELRSKAFDPYDAFSVGETPGIGIETGRLLSGEDRKELDLIFNFDHLENPGKVRYNHYRYDLNYLKKFYINYHQRISSNDWIAVFLDNHDNPRFLSKIEPEGNYRKALSSMLVTLQATMKGTPFFYQGQELACTDQKFESIEDIRDVEAINLYKNLLVELGKEKAWQVIYDGARDHARVPMAWTTEEKHGFTEGTPWIEGKEKQHGWTVEEQEKDANSALHYFRRLLQLRKQHQALRLGEIRFVAAKKKDYFAYFRELENERFFIECNLSNKSIRRPFFGKEYYYEFGNYDRKTGESMEQIGKQLEAYEVAMYRV